MREADKLLVKFGQVKDIDQAEGEIEEVAISKPIAASFSLEEVEAKQRVRETKKALRQIAQERKVEEEKVYAPVISSPRKNRAYATKLKLPPAEKRKSDHPKVIKSKEHPVTTLFRYYMTMDAKETADPDVGRLLSTLIFICFVNYSLNLVD